MSDANDVTVGLLPQARGIRSALFAANLTRPFAPPQERALLVSPINARHEDAKFRVRSATV